jgi:hypothetical protein
MPKMNLYNDNWPLIVEVCPCDVHFNEWTAKQKLRNKTIYHFGSGLHHIVGIEQAKRKNHTFGITASKGEYDAYVELVTANPVIAKNYVCYYGDIYLSNPQLLPELDVVTLFHLCEFFSPSTVSKAYGGMTDAKLLDLLTDKVRKGGHVLFYTRSNDYSKAVPIIPKWQKAKRMKRAADYKTLQVFQKA